MGVFRARDRKDLKQLPLTAKAVLRAKVDADGSVKELKARLVARGFQQRYGIDFNETFCIGCQRQHLTDNRVLCSNIRLAYTSMRRHSSFPQRRP
jgi:hypothetical protein